MDFLRFLIDGSFFQISNFPPDFIRSPSEFFRFLLNLQKFLIFFLNLVYQILDRNWNTLDRSMFIYLFIFVFWFYFVKMWLFLDLLFLQVIWFSRIKSASQMSRLIFNAVAVFNYFGFSCSIRFYIRIYSRIRWFPGDFNERLYLANDQFGFSTILQFASWILLFLVDIKCNFEFYKQFYYLFTHIEECSLL